MPGMRILFAILLPPLGVLLCGKPFQALLNVVLCIVGVYVGGLIHALFIVNHATQERRHREVLRAMRA